jgi:hypothetical protein
MSTPHSQSTMARFCSAGYRDRGRREDGAGFLIVLLLHAVPKSMGDDYLAWRGK